MYQEVFDSWLWHYRNRQQDEKQCGHRCSLIHDILQMGVPPRSRSNAGDFNCWTFLDQYSCFSTLRDYCKWPYAAGLLFGRY
jgi:hypothetical protein